MSGGVSYRRLRSNYYAQSGAALSHKKCDPPGDSTGFELKLSEGVLDVSTRPVLRGTLVLVNFTRSYSVLLFV